MVAAEFYIEIVDGLNRPLSGVAIDVSCFSQDKVVKHFRLESGQDGTAYGEYAPALCQPSLVTLKKEGYESYSTRFRARYVLRRQATSEELLGVLQLGAPDQRQGLRELLAGNPGDRMFRDLVFRDEAQLRPSLRDLTQDPGVTERARDLLAMIGDSDDLHLILQSPLPTPRPPFPERWRYTIATALVNPDDEDEWSFLSRCAANEFYDGWVDAGAIQTLRLTASPRSRAVLEAARQKNTSRASMIERAIQYIDSNPPPLRDADLKTLADRAAKMLAIGTWTGNGEPRFNEAGDKALVDFNFRAPEDSYVYTATFHRVNEAWELRGVHETAQAFLITINQKAH